MTDPTRDRQLRELDEVELCTRILYQARSELYVNMHFLDVSLSSLGFEADWQRGGLATDGALIYYGPDYLRGLFARGRVMVNRAYLHMLFHCLFCHPYTRKGREKALWDLACDIAMESVIDGLDRKCVHVPRSALRRETYLRLEKTLAPEAGDTASASGAPPRAPALTAERVYRALSGMKLPKQRLAQLAAEFHVDDHDLWEQEDPRQAAVRQNLWNDNREKMQTAMETMGGGDGSDEERGLMESLRVENREHYDYRRFLRKFAVLHEELQVDEDSFDNAFYTYGLQLYGNVPLIEPLETKEIMRIEEFVIVIDTSMSCSGELVERFLEETYDVLTQSQTYFRRIRIHVIQCDDRVQSDVCLAGAGELRDYMEHLELRGGGGTDFRPAFAYVEELRAKRELNNLKGLIYFTDGKGIYPVKAPAYRVAFVFIEGRFEDQAVPPWAMRVVLEEEQIMEYGGSK